MKIQPKSWLNWFSLPGLRLLSEMSQLSDTKRRHLTVRGENPQVDRDG